MLQLSVVYCAVLLKSRRPPAIYVVNGGEYTYMIGEKMIKGKERVVRSRETEMKNAEEMKEEVENVILRWEKFVPKMEMRVLLVEADDSTRHIITALLNKCCYKGITF